MSNNKPNKPKQVSWFGGCGGRIGVVVGQTGEHAYTVMAQAGLQLEAALPPVSKSYFVNEETGKN